MALPTWQNKSVAHFLTIKKKKARNEINKRRETGTREEFESLYLVCYDEKDKYDDKGSPKLLKCFSGIEGRVNVLMHFVLLTFKMTVLKVARNIRVMQTHTHANITF
jgi:hypothetical protein